jgi:N-acetylneuraminate synthase
VAICTPFDERSVDLIEAHGFDVIKIASCSLTDWPLLERVSRTRCPLIVSTAGTSIEDIDKVVLFLEHWEKRFAVMHCVGEYPTPAGHLRLDRIDQLKQRYPHLPIGFSTHEAPENVDAVKIAVGKGAVLFERHVGIQDGQHELNGYSSTPEQAERWLSAAHEAYAMCRGAQEPSEKELNDLKGLQRGVFAAAPFKKGEKLSMDRIFLAIPNIPDQLVAQDLSKYMEFTVGKDIAAGDPVLILDVQARNIKDRTTHVLEKTREILLKAKVPLPNKLDLEISHHYGIDRFGEWGAVIINCVNREYCKKLIIMLPGQKHPGHHHIQKEETFHVLFGDIVISLDGVEKAYGAGDMIIVERGKKHAFFSSNGVVFEEISTTHVGDDSFYEDMNIGQALGRKTCLTLWPDWVKKGMS